MLSSLMIVTVNATKPTTITATLDAHLSYFDNNYYPGDLVQIGKSGMAKLQGRYTEFVVDSVFGQLTIKSKEDAIIHIASGIGITNGDITMTVLGQSIKAKSVGKVFPDIIIIGNIPVPVMGFSGHIATVGTGNKDLHVTGDYSGYFIPDNPPISGQIHMEMNLKIN